MPTTRKSSRLSSGPLKGQSTLSFNHRVTKSVPKSAKDLLVKPTASSSLSKGVHPDPAAEATSPKTEDVSTVEPTPEPESPAAIEAVVVEKTEAERKAEKISDAAIEQYWKKIDGARRAKAVHRKHTADLTTGEKVLRYFDVSSQYGPCVGTPRLQRWQRAERLGLNPPIEVLAALLKEQASGDEKNERAHMDELLSSTAVGSV
ncbi:DNA polymerase delta, subunit 4-domain-containing protein [Podospora didyma]|uniref:DNA polymerase delta, subunit 4-domain-containing protein n=1 Tax=Podospora didyma TaxID=330526 RepID=A0AAE0U1V3_9PEZI|nr:DNA polymerase delta, subunit 4-domain-containing protein [Podospora didyma]